MGTSFHLSTYRGQATIDGYRADVDLSASREILYDDRGRTVLGGYAWSGRAAIINPPSFNLLEFTGIVDVTIGQASSSATVVDATPGSGFIYLHGAGRPPFDIDVEP